MMRWNIYLGLFALTFIFTFLTNVSGENSPTCISDSDGLSYSSVGIVSLSNGVILQDFCLDSPNSNYLVEFTCNDGRSAAEYHQCELACNQGRCDSGINMEGSQDSNETGAIFAEQDLTDSMQQSTGNQCEGCFTNDKCFGEGQRFALDSGKEKKYCGINKIISLQKQNGLECKNNYECASNICTDDQCKNSREILSGVSFLERGMVKLSCLFKSGDSKNSCLLDKAQKWGLI
ncbi:MAG: hypothetical protein Q8Q31_00985 [Nanoarchaeota archaeon]|nr:hypothetical protein [Nanoarchaeota archaeon]